MAKRVVKDNTLYRLPGFNLDEITGGIGIKADLDGLHLLHTGINHIFTQKLDIVKQQHATAVSGSLVTECNKNVLAIIGGEVNIAGGRLLVGIVRIDLFLLFNLLDHLEIRHIIAFSGNKNLIVLGAVTGHGVGRSGIPLQEGGGTADAYLRENKPTVTGDSGCGKIGAGERQAEAPELGGDNTTGGTYSPSSGLEEIGIGNVTEFGNIVIVIACETALIHCTW